MNIENLKICEQKIKDLEQELADSILKNFNTISDLQSVYNKAVVCVEEQINDGINILYEGLS